MHKGYACNGCGKDVELVEPSGRPRFVVVAEAWTSIEALRAAYPDTADELAEDWPDEPGMWVEYEQVELCSDCGRDLAEKLKLKMRKPQRRRVRRVIR